MVQEMIPGDDTSMLSVTAYVDTQGRVTLLGGAQVLLEEHTPGALGNPAAMFTTDLPEVFEQSVRFLHHTGYRGYANFDVKIDPRDGVGKFFEVNPRIGRNNYYMTAAGANVAAARGGGPRRAARDGAAGAARGGPLLDRAVAAAAPLHHRPGPAHPGAGDREAPHRAPARLRGRGREAPLLRARREDEPGQEVPPALPASLGRRLLRGGRPARSGRLLRAPCLG
ncbi:hypothetical protein [Brachybacterium sp. GPGPB12]|uniref:hypothetical protein n=1 Tax=Brachybacterium sp. GPGPB12 TaxID=3023517 RepID=UPI003134267F